MKLGAAIILYVLLSGQFAHSQILSKEKTHKWYIPTQSIVQYAGDLGFLSAGIGYSSYKNKFTFDLLIGYLPEFIGEIDLVTLNTKTAYRPWLINVINDKYYFVPVKLGLFSSYAIGEQYTKLIGENYPENYYWWTTRTRYGITMGQSAFILLNSGIIKSRAVEIYYEFGTNDFYLYSYFENEEITLFDISHFDCGFRLYF